VSLGVIPHIARDDDDNYLLAIAESGQADFLITGDDDLLTLGIYQTTTIVTMGQFLQIAALIG
jgi:predicted nucleic acid-binding protein